MSNQLIVTRELIVHKVDGTTFTTSVGVSAPKPVDSGSYEIVVSMGALDRKDRAFSGTDSWQAMHLGMYCIYGYLKALESTGMRFAWVDGNKLEANDFLPMVGVEAAD